MGERQQGEGESASETSEIVGGRGLPLSPAHFPVKDEEESDEEEEELTSNRPAGGCIEWLGLTTRLVGLLKLVGRFSPAAVALRGFPPAGTSIPPLPL